MDWTVAHTIDSQNEVPVTSLGCLLRGENLFIAGFASGTVKIISPTGVAILEMGAHSRCLNALACNPSKAVFATVGDDTFLNVWEVAGNTLDKLDVNLMLSSRVNDYMLVGVAFSGESGNSIVATPYDWQNIIVWTNVL